MEARRPNPRITTRGHGFDEERTCGQAAHGFRGLRPEGAPSRLATFRAVFGIVNITHACRPFTNERFRELAHTLRGRAGGSR